jgi:hypothetical protein
MQIVIDFGIYKIVQVGGVFTTRAMDLTRFTRDFLLFAPF